MKKILVIDDIKENLIAIKAVIDDSLPNCQVFAALSGKEGLKIAREEQPDAILLDIVMPEMDGFEVCQKLKEDKTTKHIPVVMITAVKTDTKSKIKGLEAGADAFLTKPIESNELSAQINVVLRIKEAEDKLRDERKLLDKKVKERIKELRESEEKFRAISESAIDSIFIKDINLKYIHVNPAMEKLFGLPVSKLIGKTDSELFGEEVGKHIIEIDKKVIAGEIVIDEREKAVRGKSHSFHTIKVPLKNPQGEITGLCGIARDITEKKQAEKLLRESEERFRDMANLLPQIVYETDINGNLTFVNKQGFESFGYSQEEYTNDISVLNTLIPEDRDKAKGNMQNILYGKDVGNTEYTALRKDGSTFPILIYSSPIFKDKIPVGLRGIIVDISERKKTEDALRKSEERFRKLLENIPTVAVQGYDANGIINYWNKANEAIYGYTEKETIGKNLVELIIPPEMRKDVQELIKQGAKTGEILPASELTLMKKDGTPVTVFSSHAVVQQSGKEPELFCVDVDLTERKTAEEALRESEKRFRQVAESAEEWIWEVDETALYTYASPVVEKLLGYKPEEIVGKKHAYDLFHPDDIEPLKNTAFETFKEKKPFFRFLNRNVHKNGQIVWLSTSGVPILDDKGNLLGYRGTDIDITEQKKAEAEIKKHREHLEELVEERTKELEEKNKKLKHYNQLFEGREYRIKDLKDRVKELEERLGIYD